MKTGASKKDDVTVKVTNRKRRGDTSNLLLLFMEAIVTHGLNLDSHLSGGATAAGLPWTIS